MRIIFLSFAFTFTLKYTFSFSLIRMLMANLGLMFLLMLMLVMLYRSNLVSWWSHRKSNGGQWKTSGKHRPFPQEVQTIEMSNDSRKLESHHHLDCYYIGMYITFYSAMGHMLFRFVNASVATAPFCFIGYFGRCYYRYQSFDLFLGWLIAYSQFDYLPSRLIRIDANAKSTTIWFELSESSLLLFFVSSPTLILL